MFMLLGAQVRARMCQACCAASQLRHQPGSAVPGVVGEVVPDASGFRQRDLAGAEPVGSLEGGRGGDLLESRAPQMEGEGGMVCLPLPLRSCDPVLNHRLFQASACHNQQPHQPTGHQGIPCKREG